MVSEHDIGTWCGMIFISTIIQGPPLYIETQSAFVEEETMTRDEKGTSYDGEEHIKNHGTYLWRHEKEYYKSIWIVGYPSLEKIYWS